TGSGALLVGLDSNHLEAPDALNVFVVRSDGILREGSDIGPAPPGRWRSCSETCTADPTCTTAPLSFPISWMADSFHEPDSPPQLHNGFKLGQLQGCITNSPAEVLSIFPQWVNVEGQVPPAEVTGGLYPSSD